MRVFKSFLDFYINSSIHVALASFALSWITLIQFDISYDKNILFFIFFASITGYNFVKYFGLVKFHHRGLAQWLKTIQIFSVFCFIAMGYYAYRLELKTLIYIAAFGVITFLYAVPIIPKKIFLDEQKNLRSISGLKVYVIAVIWTGVTVFLPLLNTDYNITSDVLITAMQRFIFVLVLMLPFEIRDLNYDSLKLATIPQKIGIRNTKILGLLLILVFCFLDYLKNDLNSSLLLSSALIAILMFIFLVCSKQHQNKYYTSFWVESIPVIWLVILLFIC
jgi:hypothetical protein